MPIPFSFQILRQDSRERELGRHLPQDHERPRGCRARLQLGARQVGLLIDIYTTEEGRNLVLDL